MKTNPILLLLPVLAGLCLEVEAGVADLSLTKQVSPVPARTGAALTYTLVISNAGPDTATGLMLVDRLPAALVPLSVQSNDWAWTEADNTLVCHKDSLAASATASVGVTVLPISPGTVCNFASVQAEQLEPDPANNRISLGTSITQPTHGADLWVTKMAIPDPVPLGSNLTYSLRVRNAGPKAATGVVLTDPLPAGVRFVSASPGCTNQGGIVTCNIGKLGVNVSVIKTITVAPGSTGQICNVVSVTGNEFDPAVWNNTDTICAQVTLEHLLALKLKAWRYKDRLHINHLLDSGARPDLPRLLSMLEHHQLQSRWKELLREREI